MNKNQRPWYDGGRHDVITIAESCNGLRVDYDRDRGMYRVTMFDDECHWQDECWFDQYEPAPVPGKAVSRDWLLKDLSDWQMQLGVYTGDDPIEIAQRNAVREVIEQFKVNVQNAPDCYVDKKGEDAPPEPTISVEKMNEMLKNAKKYIREEPEIVRCKECCHRQTLGCPMYREEFVDYDDDGWYDCDLVIHDSTYDEGFCDRGAREEDEE